MNERNEEAFDIRKEFVGGEANPQKITLIVTPAPARRRDRANRGLCLAGDVAGAAPRLVTDAARA
jgi:uracil-DNA glycosylase